VDVTHARQREHDRSRSSKVVENVRSGRSATDRRLGPVPPSIITGAGRQTDKAGVYHLMYERS
jgi:hypothetical protein